MLENLIGDYKIELAVKRLRADIKIRKVRFAKGAKLEGSFPLRAGRDFEHIQILGPERLDELEAASIHDHAKPIGGVESELIEDRSQPIPAGVVRQNLLDHRSQVHINKSSYRRSLLAGQVTVQKFSTSTIFIPLLQPPRISQQLDYFSIFTAQGFASAATDPMRDP
jgi:hypothetical protein